MRMFLLNRDGTLKVCARADELYDPIPVPAIPDGFDIFLIYVPIGNSLSHTLTLIGFLPSGYARNGFPLPFLLLNHLWSTIRSILWKQRGDLLSFFLKVILRA